MMKIEEAGPNRSRGARGPAMIRATIQRAQSTPGRSDSPVKPTSEVAHQPGQQPAIPVNLLYADRCERYARLRGWDYDPSLMSIDRLTPRQRHRALKKERQQLRRMGWT